ncbi:MAG: hypothetical protein MUC87_12400 [Bacteroidia bacterium]|jgi:hypothetical protein|nr:hypothetical protein [Bacteroidia bacterium]
MNNYKIHYFAEISIFALSVIWFLDSSGQKYEPTIQLITIASSLTPLSINVFLQIRNNIINRINMKLFQTLFNRNNLKYELNPIPRSEMDDLYKIMISNLGPGILPYSELLKIHSVNQQCFLGLYSKKHNLIGYIELFPITEKTKTLLESNQINGSLFKAKNIMKSIANCDNFYLAAIGNCKDPDHNKFLSGYIVKSLIQRLYIVNEEKPITIYCRPITKDGMNLVRRFSFNKIDPTADDNSIWRLKLDKNSIKLIKDDIEK